MLIGADAVRGETGEHRATDPANGAVLEPAYGLAGTAEVEQACALAWQAFDAYRETTLQQRSAFLQACADEIDALGDSLIERAMQETGLPRGRLEGERARTTAQLRLFADVVLDGGWLEARLDPALPARTPQPRSDLRQRHIPIGPVAVFGASNFPLAFSVAGGDTASALAAGCPVIVKAHNAHPGTAEWVGGAIGRAVQRTGMPAGTFSMLFGSGRQVGTALVADPRIKAVGFTGSRSGGTALMKVAAARAEPIPVYAEMSSINPVYLLPGALRTRADALGQAFAASLTLGAGQFCTNPGLLLAVASPDLERFVATAAAALSGSAAQVMLTPDISSAYDAGVAALLEHPAVTVLARGLPGSGPNRCRAAWFATDADAFLGSDALQAEVFGASSLLVRCRDIAQLVALTEQLDGQLTATLQMDPDDTEIARVLVPVLERKAGRLLANGWPTGVEVCHAMVHGGPYPATSDSRSTSVGSLAIRRFLRPLCYQDFPAELLPAALADDNPFQLRRLVDGQTRR
ncbi:aldehyde dehydrogenase (NADP(+)) [Burkholderia sp. 22PA0099]|uniref:aldehyde dehydrogenase (NADP(+)) n=1 Tax=Burkholderia sp. 22PA0099 TaxID=3237372 RepID=UPI0039C05CB9